VITYISDATKYVYHYTRATTALDYILRDRTLQLSPYTATNDPKETKTWDFDLITFENRDLKPYKRSELSKWLSDELKSRAKVVCFSMDRPPLSGEHMKDIYRRGYAKARMWAQYSDKHSGVCLVFDRERLLAAINRHFGQHSLMHGNVRYADAELVRGIEHHEFNIDIDLYESLGAKAYVSWHLQRHHRRLFFEKLVDWRDESEWRIVLLTEEATSLYLPIDDSLVAVAHGDATDPDISEALMAQTKNEEIQHLGISWKNSSPWYDYGSFGWIPGKVTCPRRPSPDRGVDQKVRVNWASLSRTKVTYLPTLLLTEFSSRARSIHP